MFIPIQLRSHRQSQTRIIAVRQERASSDVISVQSMNLPNAIEIQPKVFSINSAEAVEGLPNNSSGCHLIEMENSIRYFRDK